MGSASESNLKIVNVVGATELPVPEEDATKECVENIEEKKTNIKDEDVFNDYMNYAWEEPMLSIGDSIKSRSRKATRKFDGIDYQKDYKPKHKTKAIKDIQG